MIGALLRIGRREFGVQPADQRQRHRRVERLAADVDGRDPLGQDDVRPAAPVGVRHHADDRETQPLIELVGMAPEVADAANRAGKVSVEIGAAERRLVLLVVAAEPQGQRAAPRDERLEIAHERRADAAALMRRCHDHRVELPRVAVVVRLAAGPTDDAARASSIDAAEIAGRE